MTRTPVEGGHPREEGAGFRRALGEFATGVTVITTTVGGVAYGLTSNSFASVSLDPPLVLWSIRRESQSFAAFESCSHFAVNVLAHDQIAVSQRFARSGPDKFAEMAVSAGAGGAPLLRDVVASFECKRVQTYEGGDHLILLGEVEKFRRYDRPPLIFAKGRYAVMADHPEIAGLAAEDGSRRGKSGGEVLSNLLIRAYSTIAAELERRRRESGLGLSLMQARLLRAVSTNRDSTLEALLPELFLDFNASSNVLGSLVALGLVTVDDESKVSLTEKGERCVEQIVRHARANEAMLLQDITEDELAMMTSVLNRIVARRNQRTAA
ncbi:flavin reductase [Rhodoligotrophos defluvii]|uniref:flavin reductase n=1 Tax=Rhodoligotrophos defluvii TaxID=2561934 RepID=UPI0010C93CDA|nr:flavin reductase [Rhodoligotrophos defluvii]